MDLSLFLLLFLSKWFVYSKRYMTVSNVRIMVIRIIFNVFLSKDVCLPFYTLFTYTKLPIIWNVSKQTFPLLLIQSSANNTIITGFIMSFWKSSSHLFLSCLLFSVRFFVEDSNTGSKTPLNIWYKYVKVNFKITFTISFHSLPRIQILVGKNIWRKCEITDITNTSWFDLQMAYSNLCSMNWVFFLF